MKCADRPAGVGIMNCTVNIVTCGVRQDLTVTKGSELTTGKRSAEVQGVSRTYFAKAELARIGRYSLNVPNLFYIVRLANCTAQEGGGGHGY
jgi:hypothetical protein